MLLWELGHQKFKKKYQKKVRNKVLKFVTVPKLSFCHIYSIATVTVSCVSIGPHFVSHQVTLDEKSSWYHPFKNAIGEDFIPFSQDASVPYSVLEENSLK